VNLRRPGQGTGERQLLVARGHPARILDKRQISNKKNEGGLLPSLLVIIIRFDFGFEQDIT